MLRKIIAIISLFMGELAIIYAELSYSKSGLIVIPLICAIIGVIILLFGYRWGLVYFDNIWIVYIISITAILIIEPILIYLLGWHEIGLGVKIGFVFGMLGFASVILIK